MTHIKSVSNKPWLLWTFINLEFWTPETEIPVNKLPTIGEPSKAKLLTFNLQLACNLYFVVFWCPLTPWLHVIVPVSVSRELCIHILCYCVRTLQTNNCLLAGDIIFNKIAV